MWEKVATRHHKPVRLFPFGLDASDVMLYGTVDYLMKDGRTIKGLDWAARAHLVKMNGVVQMDSYQVYLVSTILWLYSAVVDSTDIRIPRRRHHRSDAQEYRRCSSSVFGVH